MQEDVAPARARAPVVGLAGLLGQLFSETRQFFADFAHLAVLDARRAAIRLAMLLSAGLVVAVLLVTAWMALVAALIAFLLLGSGLSWYAALIIAAAINVVLAAGIAWWARHLVSEMPFTALLRQLRGEPPAPPS